MSIPGYDDWKTATPPEYDELGPVPREEEEPCPDTEPAPEPADPLGHLIGGANEEAGRDPFAAMLDGMLAEGGMSRETESEAKRPEFEEHEWEFKKECVFEGDDVEMICKKCFRQMRMTRDQTTNEAMAAHKVNPDCGLGTVDEIMTS